MSVHSFIAWIAVLLKNADGAGTPARGVGEGVGGGAVRRSAQVECSECGGESARLQPPISNALTLGAGFGPVAEAEIEVVFRQGSDVYVCGCREGCSYWVLREREREREREE